MKLGLSLGLGLRTELRCRYCEGTISDHEPSCPMGEYEKAKLLLRRHKCPRCFAENVDVNKSDYFECRSCRRQFSRSDTGEGQRLYLFLDNKEECLVVTELSEKGEGQFHSDDVLKEAEERLQKARPIRKKRKT